MLKAPNLQSYAWGVTLALLGPVNSNLNTLCLGRQPWCWCAWQTQLDYTFNMPHFFIAVTLYVMYLGTYSIPITSILSSPSLLPQCCFALHHCLIALLYQYIAVLWVINYLYAYSIIYYQLLLYFSILLLLHRRTACCTKIMLWKNTFAKIILKPKKSLQKKQKFSICGAKFKI